MPIKTAEKTGYVRILVNGMSIQTLLFVGLFVLPLLPTAAHGFGGDLRASFCRAFSCVPSKLAPRNPRSLVTPVQLSVAPPESHMEGWRLVRTPGPDKNDVVSVMRTGDIMRSDAEFAGIMIRCRAISALQVAFVVITPFHPRSHPKITVGINHSNMQFQAEVIAPGSLVALPNEAEVLAKGAWQSAKELTVDIEGEGAKIHGTVSLENLAGAVAQLQASCPQ
jgi:hypothetical protein